MASVTLLDFDLTKTLKAVNLAIPSSPVRIVIDIDKALHKIMEDDPLIHQQLADAGIEILQKNRRKVQEKLEYLDDKLNFAVAQADLNAASTELKNLCKELASQSEKDARAAIEKQWKTIQGRQAALKTYKIKVGIKITVNIISILTSTATLVLSLGTAWITVLGAAKSTVDLVFQVAELTETADEARKHVDAGMQMVNKHYQAALTKWEEAGAAAHEVWDTVNPLGKLIGSSLGAVEGRNKVYEVKLQALEDKSSNGTKSILKLIEEVKKVEGKVKDKPKQKDKVKKFADQSDKLFAEVGDLQKSLKKEWQHCEEIKETIAVYKDRRNKVLRHTKFASELAAVGAGLGLLGKAMATVSTAL